ncbi:hypothetical protein A3SI_05212 [Nitritalea halalkaliphila LW7]|uniref:Uncharacterized protein n=1 Tax=Nitritalea halalkaliphila LW7 TaxID=1189621 RepID=I5C873_9BACT|nr:hypothetical protein [Nitritalea halalkaliphila]EIM78025.1 hypothetical protein A3SI_05212 [Nitritalea halalkaliphila LW7]
MKKLFLIAFSVLLSGLGCHQIFAQSLSVLYTQGDQVIQSYRLYANQEQSIFMSEERKGFMELSDELDAHGLPDGGFFSFGW